MRRELVVQIRIQPELAHWGLVALLLAALPAVPGTETITLDTYYPAPYGIYTELRTTGKSSLAESAGFVGIGTTSTPGAAKLHVEGQTYLNGQTQVQGLLGVQKAPGGTFAVDVAGKVGATEYLYAARGNGACSSRVSDIGSEPSCPGGNYASWVPGLRTEGTWYAPHFNSPAYWFWTTSNPAVATFQGWRKISEMMDNKQNWWCCTN